MDKIVEKVIPFLDAGSIRYYLNGSKARIPLPNDFGEIEVSDLNESDTIVGLVDDSFHTHGDVLRGEYGTLSDEEAIYKFLKDIFEGKYYLIEERENDELVRRSIESDLESFYKYLPETVEAKIVYGT